VTVIRLELAIARDTPDRGEPPARMTPTSCSRIQGLPVSALLHELKMPMCAPVGLG
jgi:hypothetical protein